MADVLERLRVKRSQLHLDETGSLVVGQLEGRIKGMVIDLIQVSEKENCWPWIGVVAAGGYGTCVIFRGRTSAHRAVWMLTSQNPIPKGIEVCHRCDNPPCVNPFHLFLGTHRENVLDSFSKNRAPRLRGENVAISKLTPEKVRSIRESYKNGVNGMRLAKIHNVSHPSIYAILNNQTWRHV